MKKYSLIIISSILFTNCYFGQGIYKTATDLLNNTYCISSKLGEKVVINSGTIFKGNVVNIKVGNKKQQLKKNEYYGYRDENNHVYRFFENQTYELLNPTEKIFIYRKKTLGGPKGNLPTYKYFFSLTHESKLIELTIHNLKICYKDNHKKLDRIDLYFKNDGDLIEFDTYSKKFKLNTVLD
jgi:hypothetical protein